MLGAPAPARRWLRRRPAVPVAAQSQVAALTGAALRCRGLTDDDPGVLLAATEAYAGGQRPAAAPGKVRRPAGRA